VLLGHPVAHSLSPRFQSAALRAAGLDVAYDAIDVDPSVLAATLGSLIAEGAAGNVTVPHKEAVARACDRLTPLAQRVGAVNTFWVEDGQLVGDNTDVDGFASALTDLLGGPPREDATVAILGAGGSAAAVLVALSRWPGLHIRLWNRTAARAHALSSRAAPQARVYDTLAGGIAGAAVVVNATPVGLTDDALPVPIDDLPPGAAIMDLVYRRGETAWVRAARARGHRAVDGLPMLLEQGALAFERWFAVTPDRTAMRRAVTD
jgi:shikimate dehydrogenase